MNDAPARSGLPDWLGTRFPRRVSDTVCQSPAGQQPPSGKASRLSTAQGGALDSEEALGSGKITLYYPLGPEGLRLGGGAPGARPLSSQGLNSWTLTVIQPGHSGRGWPVRMPQRAALYFCWQNGMDDNSKTPPSLQGPQRWLSASLK